MKIRDYIKDYDKKRQEMLGTFDDYIVIDEYRLFFNKEPIHDEDDNEEELDDENDYISSFRMIYLGDDQAKKKEIKGLTLVKKTKNEGKNWNEITQLAFDLIREEETWDLSEKFQARYHYE